MRPFGQYVCASQNAVTNFQHKREKSVRVPEKCMQLFRFFQDICREIVTDLRVCQRSTGARRPDHTRQADTWADVRGDPVLMTP
jgi:hypothetical protein